MWSERERREGKGEEGDRLQFLRENHKRQTTNRTGLDKRRVTRGERQDRPKEGLLQNPICKAGKKRQTKQKKTKTCPPLLLLTPCCPAKLSSAFSILAPPLPTYRGLSFVYYCSLFHNNALFSHVHAYVIHVFFYYD